MLANSGQVQNPDTFFSSQSIQSHITGINKPYQEKFKKENNTPFSLRKDYPIVLIYVGLGTIVFISLLRIVNFKEMGKE